MNPMIRNMDGFGLIEYKDMTHVHPVGLIILIVLGILMLFVSRRWAIVPMIIMACFIPSGQRIVIASLDFSFLRIMVVFGFFRLLLKKEYINFTWKPIDTAMIFWVISTILIFILQQKTFAAVIFRLGFGFDAFGMYFMFRCLIRNWGDVDAIISGTLLISIPIAFCFLIENRTGRNLFSVFGGVGLITPVREGRIRCQGPIGNSIIAGCFWASQIPLFAALWWRSSKDKVLAIIGVITSMIMVICSASSTPVLGVLAGFVGGLAYFVRYHMRAIRWGLLLVMICLHLMMKAPIWALVARVSAVGGSTSWFRYMLIDSAIRRFSEWALLGTTSTAHWFYGAQDLCNYYVYQGVTGGFLTLCLFIVVIIYAFRDVGMLWRRQKRNTYRQILSWALGVSLFIHCAQFIGVAYIGTITILWYLLLAIIASLAPAKNVPNMLKVYR
ncbi:MAG: hypothetical protein A4E53_00908 [Pelotomaculum sp. PtaB.Bin104]|jgi:hypothetical protein|nr:MAG: hypothetical protein A4E53_00908 [Pelotomaculum sp. PtaB.Bin104]